MDRSAISCILSSSNHFELLVTTENVVSVCVCIIYIDTARGIEQENKVDRRTQIWYNLCGISTVFKRALN